MPILETRPTEILEPEFRFENTTATRKIFEMRKRIRAVAGGTSASKTISILVWLIDYCQTRRNKLCTVVSVSYPHLSAGAIRDFQAIMKDRGYWRDALWHDTKHQYVFETGCVLEFQAIDTFGKAHGPRRDILFINEANNLDYKIADQLITRTRELVWLDWNPSEEYWFYTEMQPNRDDIDFITLTYLDNEALLHEPGQITIKEIESHKHNPGWWKVYALGQLGDTEGRIYTGWRSIGDIPFEARLMRRGLDFGFAKDPLGLVDVYYHNGGFILDEQLYVKGMGNETLARYLVNMEDGDTLVIADAAEPKSIEDVAGYGVPIVACEKGPGSLNRQIKHVQAQKISYTAKSINLAKEYRKYYWKVDKNGNTLTVPETSPDHLLDAGRYALESLKPKEEDEEVYDTGNAEALIY